jgi:cytochrome b561
MRSMAPVRRFAVYDPVQRCFHWLMAALIFVGLALGVWAHELPRGELRSDVLFFHKSIGVTVLALVILRIGWRIASGAPAYAEPLGRLTRGAAHSAHMALYALMVVMPVSGYVLSSAGGNDVSWFGLFSLPSVLPKDGALSQAGREAHYLFAWAIGIVLALHLAAVVWHTTVRRDTVLTRMWPSYRP